MKLSTFASSSPLCTRSLLTCNKSRLLTTARAQTAEARLAEIQQHYNLSMKSQMNWGNDSPYEYKFDRGLYYHEVYTGVYVGTQPRHVQDVCELVDEERITHILSLTEDRDAQYWGLNMHDIKRKYQELDVAFLHVPAKDFDAGSLRKQLPAAVASLVQCLGEGNRTYVHCVAGLGRSPAVVIAYLYWFSDMTLDEAYRYLTTIRPCGPNRDAIRGATCDLAHGGHHQHNFERMDREAFGNLSNDERHRIRAHICARAGVRLESLTCAPAPAPATVLV